MRRRLSCWALFFSLICLNSCVTPKHPLYEIGLSVERGLSGVQQASIEVSGHTISYLERAGSGETIVLLHGFAANKDNWIRFVRHLPCSYRILIFDLPGHGDSSYDPGETYDAFNIANRMWETFDALALDQFHLIGHSLGGWVATIQAIDRPQSILTLGLFDPAGVLAPIPSELQELLKKGDNPLLVNTPDDFERLLDFVFYKRPFMPWPIKPAMTEVYISRAAINQKIWDDIALRLEQTSDSFNRLTMPTLVLWGANNRILHVSSVAVYEEHLPHASIVIMKNCGHSPMTERPKEAAALYLSFLGVPPPTRPRVPAERRD